MAHIGDRFEDFAEKTPDKTALCCGFVRLTWRELTRRIAATETNILAHSTRGGRVALLLADPVDLLVAFFACARAGRIAVVLDADWPEAQISAVLAEVAPDLRLDALAFDGLSDETAVSAGDDDKAPCEDDLFYAGFTSGSSGTPKGYVRSHGSWLRSFDVSNREFGLSQADRIVLAGGLTHSLHLYGAVCGLVSGQEVVLLPRFDPRAVLSELSGTGAALYATPTQLHYLVEVAQRSGPLESVRQVFASGAKWRDEERKALGKIFPKADLIEFYGASETSFITVSRPEEKVPAGSVGRAATGVGIAIGDPANPAPAGTSGPVWVKSGLLFSGYICGNAPQTRWQDGWLTFGDLGFLDTGGFLYLTGRENRMIITSGLNVHPEEVEAVLETHPAVAVAVVAGLADVVRGERLEAVVQLSESLADAETVLQRHCRDRLAAGKVPRKIHLCETLPLTAGGKPDIQKVTADLQKDRCQEGT